MWIKLIWLLPHLELVIVWALGQKDADIITLMEDGSVRYNGSWKYSHERRSETNDRELQDALGRPTRRVFWSEYSLFIVSKKKSQHVVTLKSNQKRPGHNQTMEIQRPPEVASKTNSPVRKEARWTISSKHNDCQ